MNKTQEEYKQKVAQFVIDKAKLTSKEFDLAEYDRLIEIAKQLELPASLGQLERYKKYYGG